jgi:hypothetical protein
MISFGDGSGVSNTVHDAARRSFGDKRKQNVGDRDKGQGQGTPVLRLEGGQVHAREHGTPDRRTEPRLGVRPMEGAESGLRND